MRRILLVLGLVLLAAGCVRDDRYDPLPVPDAGEELPPTSTTTPADLDDIQLAGVPGTTTTTVAGITPGPATIVGRVDGPDGPVSGAIVRLERVVGAGETATLEVPTAVDGTWNASNVKGGAYRIRAYLPPTFGMLRAQVVFVEALDPKPVVLRVERFEGVRVEAAVAPQPPVVGEETNLNVRVAVRQVDAQGFVSTEPQAGVLVTLSGSGAWDVESSNPGVTGADGVAPFTLECELAGDQPLVAFLASGESYPLEIPACVEG